MGSQNLNCFLLSGMRYDTFLITWMMNYGLDFFLQVDPSLKDVNESNLICS